MSMTDRTVIRDFIKDAAEDMAIGMWHGMSIGWGRTFQTDYTDAQVIGRLHQAVFDLMDQLRDYRLDPDECLAVRRKAADVANQAFMLADPVRLEANE